jgi:ATP-dependent DNA helicase RecQ
VLRTVRKGRNQGHHFWGCSRFPSCRGTRDYTGPVAGAARENGEVPLDDPSGVTRPSGRRVAWHDAAVKRSGWRARYTSAGASLRSIALDDALSTRLSACWIALENVDSYRPADADTRRVIGMVRKLLQRGTNPPLHPDSERLLLENLGYGPSIFSSLLPGDIAPALKRPPRIDVDGARLGPHPKVVELDGDLPFDSPYEQQFAEWVRSSIGADAARWLLPQASFDLLLSAAGVEGSGDRRVDFLATPPWREPFVIEIDGGQHTAQALPDAERDRLLSKAGLTVLRIPASEVRVGRGPQLDMATRELRPPTAGPQTFEPLVWTPVQVHRLVLALLDALQAGLLAGKRWAVAVHDPVGGAIDLVGPYLELLAAIDALWGGSELSPDLAVFVCGDNTIAYARQAGGQFQRVEIDDPPPLDATIHLDTDRTPLEPLPDSDGAAPQIVVRSCNLPVLISDPAPEGHTRIAVRTSGDTTRRALRTVLRAVFAKDDFRPGQYEALTEVLEGRDCTVLLPTGAGKSLIYQLAGLCLPGRTLVIDPIVALIEDQAEGLASHGIDRVAGLTADRVAAGEGSTLLHQVASADALFILVAPERLQMQEFRNAVQSLAVATPINVAVVDEAHCVSEWGHQFRTSYLTLGRALREVCADSAGTPPPLLALTGTASRAVLHDVMFQLGIEQRTENSIVRPRTFDRPELSYRVLVTDPSRAEATLAGALRSLPGEFGEPASTFFQPSGPNTYSGLVFCTVVNGPRGITNTAAVINGVVNRHPLMFSGGAPTGLDRRTWGRHKRINAKRFKNNDEPVLVATNAFGMGIDKPNIRWVVHYGFPKSIEGYYQEVGRAGRDGEPAACVLVLTEFDGERSRSLLDASLSIDELRLRHSEASQGWHDRDDVTTALFFHVSSFPGVDDEVDQLVAMGRILEPEARPRIVEVPFEGDISGQEAQERALHRLIILGVVRDYLVEWGSKKFVIRTNGTTPDDVERHLGDFIERSQPGRLETIAASLDSPYPKIESAIEDCGRALITFVYDTIERSRRRSLREMYLVAATSTSDDEIRQRVLDHLTEGDIAPRLERLVDERTFSFSPWMDEIAKIASPTDAHEWRGTTARLLGSYPDHPGLLAGRALAEAFDPDGDITELESSLHAAITAARYRYGVPDADVLGFLDWVARRFEDSRPAVVTALVAIARWEGLQSDDLSRYTDRPLHEQHDPGLAVLGLTDQLRRTRDYLDEVVHQLWEVSP